MKLLEAESSELRAQNKILNEKADRALQVADSERLTREQAERLIKTLKALNESYETSIAAYKKELEAKQVEIARLKKSRFRRMVGGFVSGVVLVVGVVLWTRGN